MSEKTTYEELEQRVKTLEKEALQRKRETDNLLENEQDKYDKLIQDSSDAVIIVQGTELKLANNAAYKMWGYQNEEEMEDLKMTDMVSPRDLEMLLKRSEARERGENIPNRYEFRALRKDGSEFLVEISVSRIIYQGQIARQVVMRDITKQRWTEESLRKSQEQYKLLADNVTDVIWTMDMEMNYTYISPSVIRLQGFTVEEALAMSPEELMTQDSFERIMKAIAEEMEMHNQGQKPIDRSRTEVVELYRKDGSTVWTEIKGNFLYDTNGLPEGMIGINRNITERIKVEEEFRVSENKYRRLAENAKDMIYRQSLPDGKYEYVNQASVELTGYTPEEIYNEPMHIRKTIHPNWKNYLEDHWEKLLKGEVPSFYEFQIVHKSGDIRWIHQRNIIIYDDDGQPIATEGIATDITDYRNMETVLLDNARWYENFLEKLNDMVFETDKLGNITYVNKLGESITGAHRKDIIGKHFLTFCDKKSREVAIDTYQRTLDGEKPQFDLKLKNGKILHFKNEPLRDKKNKIIGVFGVARDVTELRLAEEELLKTNERLEEKVKERTVEIQEKSVALKVLLEQRGGDKKKLEEAIMSNVKELLIPNINRLKSGTLSSKQQTALNVLESNLDEIISPFANKASTAYMKLTPTEIQIANFIKHGASSKDIAESLSLSQRTVDTHRYNIRKKIGLSGKGSNLRTYLLSMT